MSDELCVAWVVDGFYTNDELGEPGIMYANMLYQFSLRICRSCNKYCTGVGHGFGDCVKIVVIRRGVSASD